MGNWCSGKKPAQKPVVKSLAEQYNLTETQLQDCKKVFEQIDTDRDGKISAEDLGRGMQILNRNVSPATLQAIIHSFDKSAVGQIGFQEFVYIIEKATPDEKEAQAVDTFIAFDTDKDGIIDMETLRKAFGVLNVQYEDSELNKFVNVYNRKGDRLITKDEFLAIYMKFMDPCSLSHSKSEVSEKKSNKSNNSKKSDKSLV